MLEPDDYEMLPEQLSQQPMDFTIPDSPILPTGREAEAAVALLLLQVHQQEPELLAQGKWVILPIPYLREWLVGPVPSSLANLFGKSQGAQVSRLAAGITGLNDQKMIIYGTRPGEGRSQYGVVAPKEPLIAFLASLCKP